MDNEDVNDNEENKEENPFDIDAMKGSIALCQQKLKILKNNFFFRKHGNSRRP